MYQKIVENGYLVSVVKGVSNGNITENEYNAILETISNKPIAEEGYDYRLKDDLTWELYEVPIISPEEDDATEEDYIEALNELGVDTDEEE